jgi:hypothetical protein
MKDVLMAIRTTTCFWGDGIAKIAEIFDKSYLPPCFIVACHINILFCSKCYLFIFLKGLPQFILMESKLLPRICSKCHGLSYV